MFGLFKLIKKVVSVTGCRRETFKAVVERRTLNKQLWITLMILSTTYWANHRAASPKDSERSQ